MRRVLVLAAAIATSIVWIPSARAGTIVSNVADGILTVNGTTEGDDVTVRCEGGQVTVNHDHPSVGPSARADLRRILVFAGEGRIASALTMSPSARSTTSCCRPEPATT
jgi:hypothetical protein